MEVPFPYEGIDKGRPACKQTPITSPDMDNMRLYDTLDNRARGGQRPGQDKKFAQQISGSANPILAICSVVVMD